MFYRFVCASDVNRALESNFPTQRAWGAAHSFQDHLFCISGGNGFGFDPRVFVLGKKQNVISETRFWSERMTSLGKSDVVFINRSWAARSRRA